MLLSLPELLLQLNLKQAVKQVILMPNMNRARIQFALMSDHGSRASKTSRGTHKADREREDRKMLEMLGSLECGYLRPKPIFPQAILGHLYLRKFGMNREQRAHIIRSTNGSSRLDDVERIIRASDLEEFRNHDRKRNDDRKPFKQPRRDAHAVQSEPQHAMLAVDGNSSSSLVEDFDEDSGSEDAYVAAGDEDDRTRTTRGI